MHVRPAFAETDQARIRALIEANHFGLLVTNAAGLAASHIPFLLDPDGDGFTLWGHLAAGNAECAAIGGPALAVFSGPHAYVSPGWYASGPAVPTWDYAAVHVEGTLEPCDAPAAIDAALQRLSDQDPFGYRVDALPKRYMDGMRAGIRAFRLRPTRVLAQWKMSQNRSAADRRGVVVGLRATGAPNDAATAGLIAETLAPVA